MIPPSIPHGYLLINKPSGPTSYDMIRRLKRVIRGVKIGHCGTLDPLASGLMIYLFGKATKLQADLMGKEKIYLARVLLGIKTDSGDTAGQVVEKKSVPPLTKEKVEQVLHSFLGEQEQIPPMYSALKKNGVPLYKLARKGVEVERKPRKVKILSIQFLGFHSEQELEIRIHCSSGTYVRTLAEDIGKKLGTVGVLSQLVRETIGEFQLSGALEGTSLTSITVDELSSHIKPLLV